LAGLNETTHSNDNVAIKVKRHNNKPSKFARWFKGNDAPKTIENSVFGDGFLTAIKREYIPETGGYNEIVLCKDKHNLLTTAGRDFFHQQCYKDTGLGTAGTAWIAVTTTAITPAGGDTALSGELTTNGFARALGTYAHSAGTNVTTLTVTFTATGVPSPNTVQASALFNQLSVGGTMSHEATFTSTAFAVNDQLMITWTLNLG
jgi:hypothetical protein